MESSSLTEQRSDVLRPLTRPERQAWVEAAERALAVGDREIPSRALLRYEATVVELERKLEAGKR